MNEDRVVVYLDGESRWRWSRFESAGRMIADSGGFWPEQHECLDEALRVNKTPYILQIDDGKPCEIDASGEVIVTDAEAAA